VSNVLSEEKKQQVIALGRLGWSLRRIQRATGVRRETAAAYLKSAGIAVRAPGRTERPAPAKPATQVITDPLPAKPAIAAEVITDPPLAKPTIETTNPPTTKAATRVITDVGGELAAGGTPTSDPQPGRSPRASACVPYRELIEVGLARGRNAMAIWQDLVDSCGFSGSYQSVRRFLRKLLPNSSPEARAVIETAPGEDYGKSRVMVRSGEVPSFLAEISAASVT